MHDTTEPQEGHNKIPKGWLLFFFGVIIFLFWYIASYTPPISGWSIYIAYEKEMAAAASTGSANAIKTANSAKEYSGDKSAIAEGAAIFASNCAPCHKADATGAIGPNLTAKLQYGSTLKDLHESIGNGRPNGMPPFSQQLGAEKISKVMAFLETLKKP